MRRKRHVLHRRRDPKLILYPRDYFIFGGVFLILIAGLFQVILKTELSTHGGEVARLQLEIERYKRENALMKVKILEKTSLLYIDREARAMGFREARDEDYIILK